MEPTAAVPPAGLASFQLSERVQPVGTWLFGFLLVALLAGHSGGFFPAAWAWAAFATWLLTAVVVALRPRSSIGLLDLTMIAGTLLFAGWFALSATWSQSVPSTLDESTRYLAYAGIVAAALVLVERSTVPHLLGGVTTAITLLSTYALGTRVFPDRLGDFESTAGYRLAGTIGYWNGLGIFAVMGLFLALGFATRGEYMTTRAVAAAALPFLATTMYLTFSRGAWLALVAGFGAALVVDPRRLQLALASAVLGLFSGVAVLLASGADGLMQPTSLASAIRSGHRFAVVLIVLGALSAVAAAVLWLAEQRIRVPSWLRFVWAAALVACVLAGASVVWQREGSPVHLAHRAWEKAQSAPQATGNNARLFDLSSNGRFRLSQVALETFTDHRVVGVGGGTYWQQWVANSLSVFPSREAHNVYAETLAELGIIGLVLMLFVLVPPVVGAVRARNSPLVPLVLASFAAWLVHAGVDWDWELMGVSCAALTCGVALIAAGRRDPRALGYPARGSAIVLAVLLLLVATTSVLTSARLDSARVALERDEPERAIAEARAARRFSPWSTQALEVIAAARLDQGRRSEARAAYQAIVKRDPRSWIAWAHLGDIATGHERERAFGVSHALNPRFQGTP